MDEGQDDSLLTHPADDQALNGMDEGQDDSLLTHPADDQVLKDVVAYVEVRSGADNRTESVRRELQKLGATVVKKFTDDVTHVIFKEGCNRTKTKALKKGIHFLSVLWVDKCKLNQQHVSESSFPANVPIVAKGPDMLVKKMKKAKSMQPRDFHEEVANSAERVKRNRKRLETLRRKHYIESLDTTPPYCPRPMVLVQDTQPRSEDDDFVFTPVRLTIPDTPPGMREKMKELNLLKKNSDIESTSDIESEAKQESLKFLQKKLFDVQCDTSESESPSRKHAEETDKSNHSGNDSVVNEDILDMAKQIKEALGKQSLSKGKYFGADSDESSLTSSQDGMILTKEKVQPHNTDMNLVRETSGNNDSISKLRMDDITKVTGREQIKPDINLKKTSETIKKTNSRRSTRRSIQPSAAYLVHEHGNSNLGKSETSIINKGTDTLKEIDSVNHVDPNRHSNDFHLQLSLSPVNESQTGVNNEKVNAEIKDQKAEIQSMEVDKNAELVDIVGQDDKPSKRNRRRTSVYSKRKSRQTDSSGHVKSSINKQNQENSNNENARTKVVEDGRCNEKSRVVTEETDVNVTDKLAKPKQSRKRKLMSLNDLTDQQSILIEPSKSSHDEKRGIIDDSSGTRKATKRRSVKHVKDGQSINESEQACSEQDGEKKKAKKKNRDQDDAENVKDHNTNRRKRASNKPVIMKAKKVKTVLADDTQVEDNEIVVTAKGSDNNTVGPLSDLASQLNLTKDKSLTCSIRETTLSMSMSRAFPDSDVSSIMASARRSIDEFSQKSIRKERNKNRSKPTFTSIREVDISTSSSESDRSSRHSNSSGHRKKMRPSLVMTSLHSHEQDVVISVVKKLGGFVITDNVNETTTHVICGEPRRTLNILQCLARGLWLLSKEWVIKSLEAGEWIPEEEFECVDYFPICKVVRMEREECTSIYRQTVFTDVGQIYVSGRSSPPRPQLVQLVKLCGGQITGHIEKAQVYVGGDYHPGLTCVKATWLLDCIRAHQTLPLERYSLDRPKRESSPVY